MMDEIIFHERAIFGAEDNVPHLKSKELADVVGIDNKKDWKRDERLQSPVLAT
jgi:hypothetical protein